MLVKFMGVVELGGIPATMLSSSVAFGAAGGRVEQLGGIIRLPPARMAAFRSRKSVVISASHKVREGESSAVQSKVLVALVAAGAALALNTAAPAWPAHAALPFQEGVKVERGATAVKGTEEGNSDGADCGKREALNLVEGGKEVASDVASSECAQKVKNAAGDVAKGSLQNAATKAAQDFATSQLGIPGPAASAATQFVTKVVE